MTRETALGASAPRHPDSVFGTVVEPSHRTSRRYLLMLDDSTGHAQWWAGGSFRDRAENTIIEFVHAVALEMMEKNVGFVSFNKSAPDPSIPRQVEEQLDRLCLAAHDEPFEVGVESRFSRELQRLCAYHPTAVLQSLRVRLIHGGTSPEVLSEILQWASRQEAGTIRPLVVELLSTGLHHTSSLVRDAAASALAYLDERAAVSHLRQALARETVSELREDLEDLIRSLES